MLYYVAQRFLLGNDEYRNPRIFVMPVVTDAKTPVRLVAPTRKEFKTSASSAPVTWSQEDENVDANGKVMAAILEIAVDCLSDKAIRTFTNFMKRYVETMTCEAALILDRPNESTCENTAAYLSFFKWDKVDLTSCAILPPKTEEEHIQIGSMYLTK